jgi:hypothetical protein
MPPCLAASARKQNPHRDPPDLTLTQSINQASPSDIMARPDIEQIVVTRPTRKAIFQKGVVQQLRIGQIIHGLFNSFN